MGTVIIALGFVCLLLGIFKIKEITTFKTPDPEKVQAVVSSMESGNTVGAQKAAQVIEGMGGELLLSLIHI